MTSAAITDIVVVGAGQAGAQAIVTLRENGFDGRLTLVGDERWLPYQRPPLSKAYLQGKTDLDRISLRDEGFYRQLDCCLSLGVRASALHTETQFIALEDRRRLRYDRLLLATGARARLLQIPGSHLPGVFYLRSLVDAEALQEALKLGGRLAIIGGGYIGLEVAAVAAKLGLEVTVFEAMDRLMARVASPAVSAFFTEVHRDAGVNVLTGATVARLEGHNRLEGVRVGPDVYPADIALIGIGSVPNDQLGRAAGLAADDGILVDEFARSSDLAIFAAGDCTRHPSPQGDLYRLESVQNAVDQAKHAAFAMSGSPRRYAETPWFWSEQFDIKLQMAGRPALATTQVVRGDRSRRAFSVFHLCDQSVVGIEAMNSPMDYMAARKLISSGTRVDVRQLSDNIIPIRSFL